MKILISLTYYRPYISGLSDYAERLARLLAGAGHQVSVLTSQYDSSLPREETLDGVRVVRVPVWLRLSKGVLMPGMPALAWRMVGEADIVNLHSPQLDGAYIAWMAARRKKPVLLTYQCDLNLPKGLMNRLAGWGAETADQLAARNAQRIITTSLDYAKKSRFLAPRLDRVQEIYPPAAELPKPSEAEMTAFREKAGIRPGQTVIGMNARLATEKGVDVLVRAMPAVLEAYPDAKVLYVGQYQNVLGEEAYLRSLTPMIDALGEHWQFLGLLDPPERAAFFHSCHLTVLPSVNATEAFGIVQVESMLCGTPVVASDLPGIRVPGRLTGMGLTFPKGDAAALAQQIIAMLGERQKYQGNAPAIQELFSAQRFLAEYEKVFADMVGQA